MPVDVADSWGYSPDMLLFLFACQPTLPPAPAPKSAEIRLDYSHLYGGLSTISVVDHNLTEPELLQRVRVEASTLSTMREDTSVEPWTRRVLLSSLSQDGALILGPTVGDDQPPTLLLRDVHFGSGTDTLDAVVQPHPTEDRYLVGLRNSPKSESLCPPSLQLVLPYVALHGTAQRADGVVVAVWHKVIIPTVDAQRAQITVEIDPDQLCSLVPTLLAQEPDLQPSSQEYMSAAQHLMRLALAPFQSPEAP